jgi:hypothetical protein
MKRVLILAYDYPPYVSVGGLRPYSWFKYMHEFGFFPVVVTRQWSNKYGNHLDYVAPSDLTETIYEKSNKGIVIRTPYISNLANKLMLKYGDSKFRMLRKSISVFYEFSQFFFLNGPKSFIYLEAESYLEKNKVDIIIATGEPFILFNYASKLSKKYNIPWIADYRDPWTQDKSRNEKGFPKMLDTIIEKKVLSNVSAITTVSEFFEKKIASLIPDKPFYILPNGYDPDAIDKIKRINQSSEKLSIAFVGTLYKWHPIESFLRASNDFISNFSKKPRFEINFYGINNEERIRELIETKYQNLRGFINIHPKMPNDKLLESLATNNLLLLFNYYSYMGTKIYDYLGLRRQILFCYSDDEEANNLKKKYYNMEEPQDFKNESLQIPVINNTNSGIIIKDEKHLKKVLTDYYSEFEEKGFIPCNSLNIEQYSRKIQARNLADIIKETKYLQGK